MGRALTVLRLAPVSFVAAISLLSALGLAGAWAVAQDATALSVILWMLPSVVVGALFTVYGTALLQGSLVGSNAEIDRKVLWRQGRIIAAVFVIFTVTVSLAGLLYVRDLRITIRQERFDQHRAIANLKARHIEEWLMTRTLDAQQRARSIANMLSEAGSSSRESRSLLDVLFAELLADSSERVSIKLFGPDGRVIASAGEAPAADEGSLIATAFSRPGVTAPARVQQRRVAASGALRLDVVTPVPPVPAPAAAAFLVITLDPANSLFPEVMQWPTDSPASEVVLIQREGARAVSVFLPAHAPHDGRREISFPLSQSNVVGVQAVMNGDGVREGFDYRNVSVLAATRHVEGLGWKVVAKTDAAVVLAPLDHRATLVSWLTLAAILVAAATSVGLWHAEKASVVALRERHARERSALARHYELMIKSARDIVMLVDDERRIVDANPAALAAYGYSLAELLNMHAVDLRADSQKASMEANWLITHSRGTPLETIHRRKDGSEFPVEVTGSFFDVDDRRYFQGIIRDITQRKRLEADVMRLGRVQAALQAAAGLVLRARDEQELYRGVCQVLINIGGYRLAYVALAQHDAARSVEFSAIAGDDAGYTAQTAITWGEGVRSRGPTGASIRTGEVQINQDFATNETMAPWREEAMKRGMRSSIGLPLRANDTVVGALTIYSDQPFAFSRDEVDFLIQFAADVSYGITLLRGRRT